jgi:hypothetical protein
MFLNTASRNKIRKACVYPKACRYPHPAPPKPAAHFFSP